MWPGAIERTTSTESTKAEAVKSRMKDMEAKALQNLDVGNGMASTNPTSNGFASKKGAQVQVHSNGNGAKSNGNSRT